MSTLFVFGIFVGSGIVSFGLTWLVQWFEDTYYLHHSTLGFFVLVPLIVIAFAAWLVWISSGLFLLYLLIFLIFGGGG